MKLSDLEDADRLVTKDYLDARLESSYALIVAGIYINHFWR
jgi:hypothetical protein